MKAFGNNDAHAQALPCRRRRLTARKCRGRILHAVGARGGGGAPPGRVLQTPAPARHNTAGDIDARRTRSSVRSFLSGDTPVGLSAFPTSPIRHVRRGGMPKRHHNGQRVTWRCSAKRNPTGPNFAQHVRSKSPPDIAKICPSLSAATSGLRLGCGVSKMVAQWNLPARCRSGGRVAIGCHDVRSTGKWPESGRSKLKCGRCPMCSAPNLAWQSIARQIPTKVQTGTTKPEP